MTPCALCQEDTAQRDLARVSSLDFCDFCRARDPADALSGHGIHVEWDVASMHFNAGLGIAGQDPDFRLSCVPKVLHHALIDLFSKPHTTGDPIFDGGIRATTNNPDVATAVLGIEGVQSAILSLLGATRVNEMIANHVTITGPTLTISARPLDGLPETRVQDMKLETAALALHLRGR